MRVVGLISGGKDSCFNLMKCVENGHEIVALANIYPETEDKDELDSFMFQTVGHMGIEMIAKAMELPLFRRKTKGQTTQTSNDYSLKKESKEEEVEDLYELLKTIKSEIDYEGVSVGAILSNYQNNRVGNVCSRLNLTPLAFLWERDQSELLNEMIESDIDAILIKVAALGLVPEKHLGKTLKEMEPYLTKMKDKFGLNVCGEGGEYETFTLNCPLFKKRISVIESKMVIVSEDNVCSVGYLNFVKMELLDKE
ncbi:DPH6 family protein [Megaselia abdita]